MICNLRLHFESYIHVLRHYQTIYNAYAIVKGVYWQSSDPTSRWGFFLDFLKLGFLGSLASYGLLDIAKLALFRQMSPNWCFFTQNRRDLIGNCQIGFFWLKIAKSVNFWTFFEENQDFWEIWPFLTWFLAFWNQVKSIGHYNFKNPIIQIILKIDFWHLQLFDVKLSLQHQNTYVCYVLRWLGKYLSYFLVINELTIYYICVHLK